jgi:hypothetical protein
VPEGLDVKFFRGRGATREALADEVFLDCGDDYGSLPNKVQEIVRWAYDKGYDYVLKCDDDVVVKPKELLASGFNQHDFVGCQEPACKPGEIKTPYGFCYWMSRKVMKLVIDAPLPGQPGSTHVSNHNNDEAWISTVLHINQIFLTHDARYFLHRGGRPRPAPAARALRAPVRMRPPENNPPPDAFAFCVYLNWNGFHCTPTETILQEYQYLFERYK